MCQLVHGDDRCQQQHPAHVQPSLRQCREDCGEAPGGAGDPDGVVGHGFAHVRVLDAVLQHRGVASGLEQAALVELGQMGVRVEAHDDSPRGRVAGAEHFVSRRFRTLVDAHRPTNDVRRENFLRLSSDSS